MFVDRRAIHRSVLGKINDGVVRVIQLGLWMKVASQWSSSPALSTKSSDLICILFPGSPSLGYFDRLAMRINVWVPPYHGGVASGGNAKKIGRKVLP